MTIEDIKNSLAGLLFLMFFIGVIGIFVYLGELLIKLIR